MKVNVERIICVCSFVFLLIMFFKSYGALAYEETGSFSIRAYSDSPNLVKKVVMISVIKDGKVVQQDETTIGRDYLYADVVSFVRLPTGIYDVRVEGEKVTTLLKKGINVTSTGSPGLHAPMQPGQGICECRYSN